MNLEERLKYWHIHCMNCGNFIVKILKNKKEVLRDDKCLDCHQLIHTRIGLVLKFQLIITNKEQWNIIKCNFII
ncbi:MAG: hypothetical protein AABY22_10050 [Nanoarchaeota archaeon]